MKHIKSIKPIKLALRKEQLRIVQSVELADVAGGDPASALCPTRRFCTQLCD
jgi:hypothetical protein